jgi:hypothetical protein
MDHILISNIRLYKVVMGVWNMPWHLLKGAGDDVIYHEWMHSWYQMVLGTNEALYPWMDEGFTQHAENDILARVYGDTSRFPRKLLMKDILNWRNPNWKSRSPRQLTNMIAVLVMLKVYMIKEPYCSNS